MSEVPEPSDEELVRRVRRSDAAAATILFDRHLPTLRARVRHRLPATLRGRVGESDIVQDAYAAAFLDLAGFEDRGDGSFGRWLRQILDHKLLDQVRRHAGVGMRDARREIRLATEGGSGVDGPASAVPSPATLAGDAEQAATLREVIEGLAEDYRTVIRLVHLEGLTLVDAGARMGRSADAARKLYGRALDRLADRLGGSQGTTP